MRIILASKSPRRRELLSKLFSDFEIIVSDADEESGEKNPAYLVKELSLRKGRAVADRILNENNSLKITVTNTSANWYVNTDYFKKWKTEELSEQEKQICMSNIDSLIKFFCNKGE